MPKMVPFSIVHTSAITLWYYNCIKHISKNWAHNLPTKVLDSPGSKLALFEKTTNSMNYSPYRDHTDKIL